MTDQELRDLVASLAVAQAKTDNLIQANAEAHAKTTVEINKLYQSLKDTRSELDGVGKSQGMVAEEFFANSLTNAAQIGEVKFDQVLTNIKIGKGHDAAQFDNILINGNSVALVEVKYRAQERTLDQVDKQIIEFRKRFPIYKDFKLYAGIASFSITDALIEAAHQKGFFVLQRSGNVYAADTQAMRAF